MARSMQQVVSHGRKLFSLLAVLSALSLFSWPAAYADLRQQAAYYHSMWRQTDARAAAVAATNPFAALGYVPEIAKWKRLYDQAMAELAKQEKNGPEPQPAQPTQPQYNVPANRGYGPPRTGLDWQPFLADLRPRAVGSALRQGDNFANKGDWGAALKDYDLASRIDPKNLLARQKADSARDKLKQAQEHQPVQATNPVGQPVSPQAGSSLPGSVPGGTPPVPQSLPKVPLSLPGSQDMTNAGGAPGFHPSQEQLLKRIQVDDESQRSVGAFFKGASGGRP